MIDVAVDGTPRTTFLESVLDCFLEVPVPVSVDVVTFTVKP